MENITTRDIRIAIESIDNSLNQLSTLSRLQAIATESTDLSDDSRRLLTIATSSIQQSCLESVDVIAIEDMNVATETLGSAIRNIWDGIKKAFKFIWDAFTWLFRSSKAEKMEKELRMLHEEIQDIIEEAPNNPKFDEVRYIESGTALQAFELVPETIITETYIIDRLQSLEPVITNVGQLFQLYADLIVIIRDQLFYKGSGAMEDLTRDITPLADVIADHSKTTVDIFIKNSFAKVIFIEQAAKEFITNEGGVVIASDCRMIDNFLFDDLVYFLAVDNYPYSTYHVKNTHMKPHKNKIKYFTAHGVSMLEDRVNKVTDLFIKTRDSSERHVKAMAGKISGCLLDLDKRLADPKTMNITISNAKLILEFTNQSVSNLRIAVALFERDLAMYKDILEMNVKHYKR